MMSNLSPLRAGRITASRVGKILGISKFGNSESCMREMVREKLGAKSEIECNYYMQWGIDHEKNAIKDFEEEMNLKVTEAGFLQHDTCDWIGATPDGVSSDGGLVECKCPREIRAIYSEYHAQMQLQMLCAKVNHCWFVQWTPKSTKIEKILFDKSWFALNYMKLKNFITEFNKIIENPELQEKYLEPEVKKMSGNDWLRETSKLKGIKSKIMDLQILEKEAKVKIIEMADNHKSEGNGVIVYPTRRTNVDYKKLITDVDVDITKYKSETESWTVRVSST